jgi:hypothetical protein
MTASSARLRPWPARFSAPAAVATGLAAAAVLAIAWDAGVKGAGVAPEIARAAAALLGLLVVAGYAPARLLVPREVRVYLPLLVPLVGAMTAGLELSALGFIGMPLAISVTVVLGTGAIAALVVRVRLGPARPDPAQLAAAGGRWLALAAPAYIALLLASALMIPVLRDQLVSVPGTNPDAMLGTGTIELLRHAGPLDVWPQLPVDHMPDVWTSKYPIYYVLAGAAELSGLSSLEIWAAAGAVLAGLTAIGFFLLARCSLGAGPVAALLATGLIASDRVLAHLALHPYHNQLWGTLTLAPMLLFGLRFIDAPNRRDGALTALFLVVGLLAYPLMVLFPAAAFAAAGLRARRARGGTPLLTVPRGRGLRIVVAVVALPLALIVLAYPPTALLGAAVLAAAGLRARLRRAGSSPLRLWLPRRRRGLWIVAAVVVALPAAVALLAGVLQKMLGAGRLLMSGQSLAGWQGDVTSYRGFDWLVGVHGVVGLVAGLAISALGLLGLRRAPRNVAVALGTTVAVAVGFACHFRLRLFGEYFHFKIVAFLFPLLLLAAGCWLARQAGPNGRSREGRLAASVAAGLVVAILLVGLRNEIYATGLQADRPTLELRAAAARILPSGASVRLDVKGGRQLWAGYVLADHPVTALAPIMYTTYPYPPQGRRADFIVAESRLKPRGPWPDAAGPALYENRIFRLYRMRDDVPGPAVASQRFK